MTLGTGVLQLCDDVQHHLWLLQLRTAAAAVNQVLAQRNYHNGDDKRRRYEKEMYEGIFLRLHFSLSLSFSFPRNAQQIIESLDRMSKPFSENQHMDLDYISSGVD